MYDLQSLADVMIAARHRDATVKLIYSHSDRQKAPTQLQQLQLLHQHRCEVRGHKARRLHEKLMIADEAIAIGSCSFTSASQQNTERAVCLEGLPREKVQSEEELYDRMFAKGEEFLGGLGRVTPPTPSR